MRRIVPLLVALFLALPAAASAQGFAIAGRAGSTGLGGSVILGVAPALNIRGSVGVVPSEPEIESNDIDWTLEFPTYFMATADFYPFGGGFYLSGGALFIGDGGDFTVTGVIGDTFQFGDEVYDAADVGDLVGTFGLESFQPYAGIGFGNPITSRVGIQFDLGVGFGKEPNVTLDATGPIVNDPDFQDFREDLDAEIADIEDDIPSFLQYYPVLSLSISIGLSN